MYLNDLCPVILLSQNIHTYLQVISSLKRDVSAVCYLLSARFWLPCSCGVAPHYAACPINFNKTTHSDGGIICLLSPLNATSHTNIGNKRLDFNTPTHTE